MSEVCGGGGGVVWFGFGLGFGGRIEDCLGTDESSCVLGLTDSDCKELDSGAGGGGGVVVSAEVEDNGSAIDT